MCPDSPLALKDRREEQRSYQSTVKEGTRAHIYLTYLPIIGSNVKIVSRYEMSKVGQARKGAT